MKRIAFAVTALLSLLSASAQEAYKPDVFYYQRSTLFDVLPVNPSDIIMLGNSLTNGGEWHELLGMPNVKNRGISSAYKAAIYEYRWRASDRNRPDSRSVL